MKVFSSVWINERAKERGYRDGRPAKFRAFPPKSNLIDKEQAFDTEEQLANFITANPDWKTYFRNSEGNNGQHLAVVK